MNWQPGDKIRRHKPDRCGVVVKVEGSVIEVKWACQSTVSRYDTKNGFDALLMEEWDKVEAK